MAEIFTVGETMAVMTPNGTGSLCYQDGYRLRMAGAESNVAIGVCKLGHTAMFCSKVGNDGLGDFLLHELRAEGVNAEAVVKDYQHPTGLMIKEIGRMDTKVYYYRTGSAASHMEAKDIELELFQDVKILHLTGVTPVLSESCRELVEKLFDAAEREGIPVAFDPNIRKKLWNENDYSTMLREFSLRAQIVLIGVDEAEILFETRKPEKIFRYLFEDGNACFAALKDGKNGAVVSDGKNIIEIPPFPCNVRETIGAGDGFNAGFLCGLLEGKSLEICGKMGAICGALATETEGDYEGYPDKTQLEQILTGKKEIYR